MRSVQLIRAITIVVVIAGIPILGFSQPVSIKIPIWFTDAIGSGDTICFGVDPKATYGIDVSLGEVDFFGECWFWCVDFISPRNWDDAHPRNLDLRTYLSPTQIDTYLVSFISHAYPVVFRWPSNLSLYYDSAKILDEFSFYDGRPPRYSANMLITDSLVIDNPRFTILYILTYGPKRTTGLPFQKQEFPNTFSLQQNYPNPFNPSTVIRYQLHVNGWVMLKVYDVFGREITKLVDAKKPPGSYEVEWKAENLPSGFYFYRLQTGDNVSVKKMILMR